MVSNDRLLDYVLDALRHIRALLNENQETLVSENLKNERKQWKTVARIVGDIRTIHDNIQNMQQLTKKGT